MKNFILSICLLMFLVSACSAHVAGVLYEEDFGNPDGFSKNWSETMNTGSVGFTASGLLLHASGNGLPSIQSTVNPFPSYDWSISFGYRYATIGHYGTQVGCESADGSPVFKVHQDTSNQYIQMNGKNLYIYPANTKWHVFTVVKDYYNKYVAYLDGHCVGSDDVKAAPTSIAIGGSHQDNPWDWNDIEMQFVRVYAGQQIVGTEALAAPQAPASAAVKAPPAVVQTPQPYYVPYPVYVDPPTVYDPWAMAEFAYAEITTITRYTETDTYSTGY